MLASDFTAAASRLCTACGMCCNGVLFHIVRLQPADSIKTLESLGMKLSRKKREPYFNQPCRFLHDCTCSIYQDRPTRCRLFECQQILGLAGGGITEDEAGQKIALARLRVNRIEELLGRQGNQEIHRPLMERCAQVLQEVGENERRELVEEMTALNELLNQSFRPEPAELTIC